MKWTSFLLLVTTLACATTHPQPAPTPPAPPLTIALVACAVPQIANHCPQPIVGAAMTVADNDAQGDRKAVSNQDGYAEFSVLSSLRDSYILIDAPGFNHYDSGTVHPSDLVKTNPNIITLTPSHVDPTVIPFGQLAAIRGAMWPNASRCPTPLRLPYGPRPGQPDNIIATYYFNDYSDQQKADIVACFKALGYTHVVMGALIVDGDDYHGQYPVPSGTYEQRFTQTLDTAEYFYDHGLTPVVFIHALDWTFEQTRDVFTPLLSQPRARRLLRVVVPTGWEPTRYGWSSCTWAAFISWARGLLPDSVILIHTVTEVDAPVGTDARCDDNGRGNGQGWTRVVDAGLDGWLIQNGAYTVAPGDDPSLARNFASQFMASGDGETLHSARWHFVNQILGWPSTTKRGRPILLYNAEVTAYSGYWGNLAESIRVQWGDLAIASGADGYLDGGTVAVPIKQ